MAAHGNLSIALQATSYREAEDAIFARRAFGVVGIPPDTERNVLKGVQARLPIYADSTYFILFNRTLQGILESVQAYAADAIERGSRPEGAAVQTAAAARDPVQLVMVPLFNPTASYSSYVVPAAFVLILHQTLLMGSAMLGGAAYEQGGTAGRRARASGAAILGQGLAHWTIYVPALLLYFVIMPRVYGFSTLGSIWQIAALSFPFILATSFLGQALGLMFRHRETAVLLVLASSLPQFFLVGASWPDEAIPPFLRSAREILPSVSAIDGFVRIGQMGASLFEVRHRWETLWVLTALYFALAGLLAYRAGFGFQPMRRLPSARMLGVGVVIVAIVALGIWYERFRRSDDSAAVAGVVRATEIHIAPEISGRLARVLVQPGQSVQRGEPLALLGNPELWAAVAEARAQADKAAADRDRVYAGVRQEEVEALRREIFKAQAVLVYARQEVDRKSVLAARSDVSQQDLDEARAETAHAEADVAVAEASYAEAQLGPTAEERALADAVVKAAEAARDVVEARAAKTLLRAPTAGVVGSIVPEIGEAIVPGEPVLTLLPDGGRWFGFNLREDALGPLAIGSRVRWICRDLRRRRPAH